MLGGDALCPLEIFEVHLELPVYILMVVAVLQLERTLIVFLQVVVSIDALVIEKLLDGLQL